MRYSNVGGLVIGGEGIGTTEERVEGNGPAKGATMGFQKFSSTQPYGDD